MPENMSEHFWYALAAFVFYQALAFLFSLALGYKSQIDAWAEARPYLAALLKFFRATGIDPWMLVQSASLAFKKQLPPKIANQPPPPSSQRTPFIPRAPRMPSTPDDDTTPPPQAG